MLAEKPLANEKFKFDALARGDKKLIVLRGTIDEDTNFDSIQKLGGPFIFNFRHLESINSCGVRSWVNFLKNLGRVQIFYEECPPLVVRQMNMVPSFLGGAKVLSVYLPYVCDNCDSERLVLINTEGMQASSIEIEDTIQCEHCKEGVMEFDGHPKQYFAYLG